MFRWFVKGWWRKIEKKFVSKSLFYSQIHRRQFSLPALMFTILNKMSFIRILLLEFISRVASSLFIVGWKSPQNDYYCATAQCIRAIIHTPVWRVYNTLKFNWHLLLFIICRKGNGNIELQRSIHIDLCSLVYVRTPRGEFTVIRFRVWCWTPD